jgi:predicted nucleotidyltransferase
MASEYRIAWKVMDRIEDALLSYAETIRGNGIVEYYFNRQYTDKYYDTFRNTLTVLNLEYCVETEKIRVIFKENIKDIIDNGGDVIDKNN